MLPYPVLPGMEEQEYLKNDKDQDILYKCEIVVFFQKPARLGGWTANQVGTSLSNNLRVDLQAKGKYKSKLHSTKIQNQLKLQ